LWHPAREHLFWFDIMGKRLMTRDSDGPRAWDFDRHVSAAGWVDDDTLLIATETDLIRFSLATGQSDRLVALEADKPATRSNDGRADPMGGFWIGTMGKNAEARAGSLYRYWRGELRRLRDDITIPNATCFAPDGRIAYFADTAAHLVWRVALDTDGWPVAQWEVFLDHRDSGINPDGAVVDAAGHLIVAEWGGSRVARYDHDGNLVEEITLPVPQPTCPAFGGSDLSVLYVTSARQGLPGDAMDATPLSGQTLVIETDWRGQLEHRVIL
jgi:sugar lactone lactonase YvrE